MDDAMRVLSILIAGMVFYGGLGWGLDQWLHTVFLMPTGLVLGTGLGVYLVIKRYGSGRSGDGGSSAGG
ncbi:MAG: AtpZ/AtpI family protein [Propionibacteriaceae bacterium]|jgi:F0F1-type ATP synthase assembly protein I|nr:AtpZ/AtpI family protein [Propionibacteriaceae bacterium]